MLVVCTANICRSPAAARLLAGRLGPSIEFFSRGVRAIPGAPACEVASSWALMNGGVQDGGHQAQQLTEADIKASTLILTASRRQRAVVTELRPSAQVRTFTLRQAARIATWRMQQPGPSMPLDADLPHRLLWLAEEMDVTRGMAPRDGDVSTDDLRDPHGSASHADSFALLLAAVDAISAPLLQKR